MAITKVTTPDLIDLPNNQLVTGVSTTYNITVIISGSNNKYAVDGVQQPDITLIPGTIYIINQDDSTNNLHPLILSTSSAAAGVYSTGVTYSLNGANVSYASYISGFAAATQRRLTINLSSPPALSYICYYHSGMGSNVLTTPGAANTDGVILPKGSTSVTASVEYLIVAGGGGGGGSGSNGDGSGGGGAGGLLTNYSGTGFTASMSTSYSVIVGAGGAGGANPGGLGYTTGTNGDDSTFETITASGGGGGGAGTTNGLAGASGGGSGYNGSGGGSISGEGNDGGSSNTAGNPWAGSGGGGAGFAGNSSAANNIGGAGGNGLQNNITGTNTYYAGGAGGGGGIVNPYTGGAGGLGGGADGASYYTDVFSGTPNTGGGGSGSGSDYSLYPSGGAAGGSGGSGVVILRTASTTTATFVNATTSLTQVGGGAWTSGDKVYTITATTGTSTVTFSSTASGGRPTTNLNIGEFRYNTTDKKVEYYDGAGWFTLDTTVANPQ